MPGSCHDAIAFANSNLFKYNEKMIPKGTKRIKGVNIPFLTLGDPAYPLQPWLMKNYTYDSRMSKEEDSFNAYMNTARVTVEIAIGRLKGRFRRIQKAIDMKVSFAPKLVASCCVLHNIIETRENSYENQWTEEFRTNTAACPQPDPEEFEEEFVFDQSRSAEKQAHNIRNALKEHLQGFPMRTSIKWTCIK